MRMGAFGGVAVLCVLTTPALAQARLAPPGTICAERGKLVLALKEQYLEEPRAFGQVDGTVVIEVFVSVYGTWTILATGTDGMSCLVAEGDGWEGIPPAPPLIAGVEH